MRQRAKETFYIHISGHHATPHQHKDISNKNRELMNYIDPFESPRTYLTPCRKLEDQFGYFVKEERRDKAK
jgi:hypothetical protein